MRKIVEGFLVLLVLIGFGYILYKTIFLPSHNLSLLKERGVETKGYIYEVGGHDLGVWFNYVFEVDGRPYYGAFDFKRSILLYKGDSLNVLYLEEDPNINEKKEEVTK